MPPSARSPVAHHNDRPMRMAASLKEAREARSLSLRQIADATKLSTQVIRDLEEGRIDGLPSGIYRRAIVRAVAREVGLDPEQTLSAFLDDAPEGWVVPSAHGAAAETTPIKGRQFWRRLLAAAGAIIPLLVGVAYFGKMPERRAPEAPPALSAARAANTWRPEIVPAGGFTEPPPPAVRPITMLITVSARCDLRVIADGGLVVGRTFEAGESLQVAFGNAVELSGTNAGVVQFSINGRAGRLLGAAGEPLSARIGRDDYPFFLVSR